MDFQTHLTSFLKKEEVDSLLISLNQASQTAFRLNTLKIKEITDIFNPCPFLNHPDVKNGFYFDKVLNPLGKSILFEAGAFYIQEPSAMLAVEI